MFSPQALETLHHLATQFPSSYQRVGYLHVTVESKKKLLKIVQFNGKEKFLIPDEIFRPVEKKNTR